MQGSLVRLQTDGTVSRMHQVHFKLLRVGFLDPEMSAEMVAMSCHVSQYVAILMGCRSLGPMYQMDNNHQYINLHFSVQLYSWLVFST